MRVVKLVPIKNIKMDRHPLNPSTMSLIDYLRKGGEVPPIQIALNPEGRYIIRDGRHRITAFKMLGRDKIMARFSTIKMEKL